MPASPPEGASAPFTLRYASIVAVAHTLVVTAVLVPWLMMVGQGYPAPMRENLVALLPCSGAVSLASGALLSVFGVRAPFGLSALVTLTATFGVAFWVEAHSQGLGMAALLLALPIPVVFAALMTGAAVPRARLRPLAACAVVVVALLATDAAMRYPMAQRQQQEAADALADYDTVAVLDAPGWTLTHAYDRSAFPELVYRDLLGRTVLLGSTPDSAVDGAFEGGLSTDVLEPDACATGTDVEIFVADCEVRAGMLVVRMEGAYPDREVSDDTDRWPSGWTEVRTESADGRYVRLRSASPGLDLVGLAESIEEAAPSDPEASAADTSCLLRCPVWRNYHP